LSKDEKQSRGKLSMHTYSNGSQAEIYTEILKVGLGMAG